MHDQRQVKCRLRGRARWTEGNVNYVIIGWQVMWKSTYFIERCSCPLFMTCILHPGNARCYCINPHNVWEWLTEGEMKLNRSKERLIFRRADNLKLQSFKRAGSNVEPWTWNIPTSLVCCMHSAIFLFSQHNEDGSPWDPLDKYSSLQLWVTHRPSCLERICYLSALPPVHAGLKQSFGGMLYPRRMSNSPVKLSVLEA